MKKFFLCLLVLGIWAGFTACNDDDERYLPIIGPNLVGVWQAVWTSGYQVDVQFPGSNDQWNEPASGGFMTFYAGGIGRSINNVPFSWNLNGNMLLIYYADSGGWPEVSRILSLTPSEMVMEIYESRPGFEYYEMVTFQRY